MGYIGVKTIVAKLNGEDVSKIIDTGVRLVKKVDLEDEEVKALLSLQ
jgi:ABC-type sugar transport system substrate-binding protein